MVLVSFISLRRLLNKLSIFYNRKVLNINLVKVFGRSERQGSHPLLPCHQFCQSSTSRGRRTPACSAAAARLTWPPIWIFLQGRDLEDQLHGNCTQHHRVIFSKGFSWKAHLVMTRSPVLRTTSFLLEFKSAKGGFLSKSAFKLLQSKVTPQFLCRVEISIQLQHWK